MKLIVKFDIFCICSRHAFWLLKTLLKIFLASRIVLRERQLNSKGVDKWKSHFWYLYLCSFCVMMYSRLAILLHMKLIFNFCVAIYALCSSCSALTTSFWRHPHLIETFNALDNFIFNFLNNCHPNCLYLLLEKALTVSICSVYSILSMTLRYYRFNVRFLHSTHTKNAVLRSRTKLVFLIIPWTQVWYKKRLLLRCIHHSKSDLINNMDYMRISGTEPSSVIFSQTK